MSEPDAAVDQSVPHRGRTGRRIDWMRSVGGTDEHVVMYFKERIYATFTGLAIVLVASVSDDPTAGHAAIALVFGVLGITAAGFVSDIVSHLAVHRDFPTPGEVRILLRVSAGALGTLLTPLILIGLAFFDILPVETALVAAVWVYVVTLGLIGWFAVRRSHIVWWKQMLSLAMLMALGLIVVVLQTLAHSE